MTRRALIALPLAAIAPESEQDEWDREMERDFAPGGAGAWLIEEMKTDKYMAIERLSQFGKQHGLSLEPATTIKDLINEGRR